jgi:hypothetical protein
MKTRGSKTGGIIMIVMGAIFAALFLGIAIYNSSIMSEISSSEWPGNPYGSEPHIEMAKFSIIIGLFFATLICIAVIVLGVFTLKRGVANQKVVKAGRPSTCIVEDLRSHHFRHGGWTYQLIVSYRDENGNTHKYSTQISRYDYEDLRIGMKLECLVAGEECYIDINNIKVVEDQTDY